MFQSLETSKDATNDVKSTKRRKSSTQNLLDNVAQFVHFGTQETGDNL